jgi:alkyldihydroxyacetonephosphate synthase
MRAGLVPASPACIVWPESPEEVSRVFALAAELGIPIVPFGAGSGVCGGARPVEGGITVDFKRMRAIRNFDGDQLQVEVETGIIGERLERRLNDLGYTLGHFPSSIICSTLGGWLAARSAGQTSSLYGKIEDMTLGLEVVTPGRIRHLISGPRPGMSPNFNALVLGSEGTFGAITAATLRIRPLPQSRLMRGLRFPNVDAGLEAIRSMLQAGLRPAVLRLYDSFDTFLARGRSKSDPQDSGSWSSEAVASRLKNVFAGIGGSGRPLSQRLAQTMIKKTVSAVVGSPLLLNKAVEVLPDQCLLILGFEGQSALNSVQQTLGLDICRSNGAVDLGEAPGAHWLANRHNVSFKQSKAYASGLFTDTMEVAANWERLGRLYRNVRRAISREAFVMAHFSHAYPEGCSIYFTFAGAGGDPNDCDAILERYDRIWKKALIAVHESGGTVSHHHGVGILKAEAMGREHGAGGMQLLHALKHGFDPSGIMNPGKLGLHKLRWRVPSHVNLGKYGERIPREIPREIQAAVGASNLVRKGKRTSIRPPDEGALAAVLRLAYARGITLAVDQMGFRSSPGAMRIDMSAFGGLIRLSKRSLFVEVEAGILVHELETSLRKQGLSLGHLHPRCLGRSVGASLAFNTLIRRSIAHGDLDDVCFAVRGLLSDGTVIETRAVPRSATGPELDRALVGSAGRWGIITRATLRVIEMPKYNFNLGFAGKEKSNAITLARRVFRHGIRPGAARCFEQDGKTIFLVSLFGQDAGLLQAQKKVVSALASEEAVQKTDSSEYAATGGRFDAVVELELPWMQAAEIWTDMQKLNSDEIWLDFMCPESLTLVSRVSEGSMRRDLLSFARERGLRILSGDRHFDSMAPVADDAKARGCYDDIAERISSRIDPKGLFVGR